MTSPNAERRIKSTRTNVALSRTEHQAGLFCPFAPADPLLGPSTASGARKIASQRPDIGV